MNLLNQSWIEMCGPGGLVPWNPSKRDVGACFQQIFLQVPVMILFSIVSAYYYGGQYERRTNYRRGKWAIRCRFIFSLLIAIVPATKTIVGIKYAYGMFRPVDYLTSGMELIAWTIHTFYVLSLRYQTNYHGPVVVRVLWILTAVLSIINLRTNIISNQTTHNIVSKLLFGFSTATTVLQALYGFTFIPLLRRQESSITSFDRHTQYAERSALLGSFYQGFREDLDPEYLGVAMEEATFTSKMIFHWVNPLMKKGTEKKLKTCDDLYDLPTKLNSSYLCVKLHSAMHGNKKIEHQSSYGAVEEVAVITEAEKISLLKALHKCFGVQFYSVGILKLLADALTFAGPMLLNLLVNFIESKEESMKWGYLCAGGLFLTTFVGAFLNVHFNFLMAQVGLQLRGALISTIYRKTLNLSYSSINKFSIGEIVNFMSTDTDRIVNSCQSFHAFWSIPLQLAVTFYLLYMQVGLAFLAGVAFTIVLIPINKVIASKIGQLSTKLMTEKDQRVAAMTEILRGIRVLKVHVWEEHFLDKILNIRQGELKYLRGRKYLDALCVYFWATTPVVISILTFATYSLMGFELTAAVVFTTMALLNMLIAPLNAFPWVLNGLTEAWVSLSRIQKFLDLHDSDVKDYFRPMPLNRKSAYSLNKCTFAWNNEEQTLNDDAGETSLPAEVDPSQPLVKASSKDKKGKRLVKVKIQEEENVVIENSKRHTPDRNFLLKNLDVDIKEGELVGVIGSVGSGKSTLLAALLGEITKIKGSVLMKNIDGGCAFVTQSPWIQRGTLRDNILFGKGFDSSFYRSVLDACCLTQDIENPHGGDVMRVGEGGMTLSGGQRARVAIARAVYQDKDIYLMDDILSSVDVQVARHIYNKVVCGLLKEKTRILCTNQIQLLANADLIIQLDQGAIVKVGKPSEVLSDTDEFSNFDVESTVSDKEAPKIEEETEQSVDEDEEVSDTGAVRLNVYQRYWTSIGHFLSFMILLSIILMQSSRNVTDLWLSIWVSQDVKPHNKTSLYFFEPLPENTTEYYLVIYVLLAVINTFFTLFRAFLFAYGGIHAACKIHEKLLNNIMYSKIVFFDVSPIGRILNRFSSDTYTIDDSLPFILNILLAQFFGLLGSLAVTVYGLPWLCLLLAPLVPIYHYIQNTYRHSSRELKRLSSVTLSPIYSHFTETLQGLTTIRAFRCLSRFKRTNEDYLECNQKAQFASQAANQWLSFRLQMIGVIIVTGVSVTAVLQHQFDVVDSALVGLTISYALSITGILNGVVSAFAETEKEFISLERVGQYVDEIEPEVETGNNPPYAWPGQGVIIFQSVYMKYREHLAPSLNGISFETRPAEKIGVVGRTGAGKSSLIVALLRLVRVSSGNILIDTVNINNIGLQGLRSRIAVIPQDPFLFEGTVRDNVDPLEEYRDNEVWSALDKCHLRGLVEGFGGLKAKVLAGGRNFSQGQRQLLCLVRAVLRNAKIVCVDEATASVDNETDKQIQQTIRSSFRQSTVLTIAHRISTVMDSDRILVLGDGEVIEFDAPENLAMDKNTYFYQLCQQEIQ